MNSKPRILCVDDDEDLLAGLALQLERRYALSTALSGAEALDALRRTPNVAVIMSDMRMPNMNGATFLARSRELAPHAVRLLLTGQTDLESAICAVNDGQIFRFLTKPCPPPALLCAIEAAIEQHRLITAERELLEQTLHGCIKALTDVLALANPAAFGRATRIKHLVSELCAALGVRDVWQVEVAAMLSQLAHVTLSAETADKLYFGRPLTAEEQRQVDYLPTVTEQLLANIPRIDSVRSILSGYLKPVALAASAHSPEWTVALGAQILRVAVDYDALESRAGSPQLTLDTMRSRGDRYSARVLEAAVALHGDGSAGQTVKEVPAAELIVGMLLAEDVFLPNGILLVARGHEITPRFMERIRNLPSGTLKRPVRVNVRGAVLAQR